MAGGVSSTMKQCWACRKGRLVCDFGTPQCQKCIRRGVECPGYGDAKPLVWIPNNVVKTKQRKGRQQNLEQHAAASRQVNRREAAGPPPRPGRLLMLPEDLGRLSNEIVVYYNARICPDLVASGQVSPNNPYHFPPEAAPYIPVPMLQTFCCVVLGHRILQLTPDSNRAGLVVRLQEHRGKAIRAISRALADKDTQTSDETLWCILVFLLAEVCGPSSGLPLPYAPSQSPRQGLYRPTSPLPSVSWRQHHDGASAIMEMRGGLPKLVTSSMLLRPVLLYYIVLEVIGSTTSPPLSAEQARRQVEFINVLPILYGDGELTTTPCPAELFVVLIRINHLRSVLSCPSAPLSDSSCAVRGILDEVRAFSPRKWATKVSRQQQGDSHGRVIELEASTDDSTSDADAVSTPDGHSAFHAGWERVSHCYQDAVTLYCISSLPNTAYDGEASRQIQEMRSSCRAQLVENLKEISRDHNRESGGLEARKLVLRPLVVAGTEIDPADVDMRDLIKRELEWISLVLGTASPLVAKELLERMWERESDALLSSRKMRWDATFDSQFAFVV